MLVVALAFPTPPRPPRVDTVAPLALEAPPLEAPPALEALPLEAPLALVALAPPRLVFAAAPLPAAEFVATVAGVVDEPPEPEVAVVADVPPPTAVQPAPVLPSTSLMGSPQSPPTCERVAAPASLCRAAVLPPAPNPGAYAASPERQPANGNHTSTPSNFKDVSPFVTFQCMLAAYPVSSQDDT
jgi:hypothetical protein